MIFVDTWAWIALADKSDPYHRKATALHRRNAKAGERYVTTTDVLGETITYLFGAIGADRAHRFVSCILIAVDAGPYQLVHVSPEHFRRAWVMRQKYRDKPDISFVDFTSIVVMQELAVTDVFTGDAHFRQVNLGFRLVP